MVSPRIFRAKGERHGIPGRDGRPTASAAAGGSGGGGTDGLRDRLVERGGQWPAPDLDDRPVRIEEPGGRDLLEAELLGGRRVPLLAAPVDREGDLEALELGGQLRALDVERDADDREGL